MSLGKSLKGLKLDTRMYDFNVQQGVISPEEYKKYLDSLPDLAEKAEAVDIDMGEGDAHIGQQKPEAQQQEQAHQLNGQNYNSNPYQ